MGLELELGWVVVAVVVAVVEEAEVVAVVVQGRRGLAGRPGRG